VITIAFGALNAPRSDKNASQPEQGDHAMKNRFVCGVCAAALIAAWVPRARAAEPAALKFGFPAPATSYVNIEGMTPWIDAVERASGGTLKIKLFAGPTLGTFRNIYERTLANVAQIAFSTLGALAGQFPRTQVAGLPRQAKAAIEKYSGEAFSEKLGANNEAAGEAESKEVAAKAGQHVYKLSASQAKLWEAKIEPVIDGWAKHAPDGAKVLAAYRDEIKKLTRER
jgi:TRAP-type C4-dicarboxylate transport system substrate-binding protein